MVYTGLMTPAVVRGMAAVVRWRSTHRPPALKCTSRKQGMMLRIAQEYEGLAKVAQEQRHIPAPGDSTNDLTG